MNRVARCFTLLFALFMAGDIAWSQDDSKNEKSKSEPAAKQRAQPSVEVDKPTHAEVEYGPVERNVLDFYQAKSEHARDESPSWNDTLWPVS